MDKPDIRLIDATDDVEYQFFDRDPDGDEDRAGDGVYFRIPGDEGWSGPWHSEDQAIQEATDTLQAKQKDAVFAEFRDAGYVVMPEMGGRFLFARAVDDVYGFVQVSARTVVANVVTADRGSELAYSEEFDGTQRFGAIQMAAREAIEALDEEIGPSPTAPRP
jgi:hypothetical protein